MWKISARLGGKRLHNLLPQLVESLEHHGHLQLKQFMKAAARHRHGLEREDVGDHT